MNWEKFDYNNFKIKNGVEYFVLVKNIRNNSIYYDHIQCIDNTFYMTKSDADNKFNWDYNVDRILYYIELPSPNNFIQALRRFKISKLLGK